MKIYNKFLYGAAMLGLTTGLLTSCHDKDDYTPGEQVGGAQAYFPSNTPQSYDLSADDDAGSFSLTVYRVDDSAALDIPVTVTVLTSDEVVDFSDAFDFPSSVSFAAGQKSADFTVTYDISAFVDDDGEVKFGDEQQFQITLDESSSTPYGVSSLVITAVYPEPWTMLGEGEYYDYYWGVQDTEDDWFGPISVTVEQNDLDPTRFRIQNPYREWNEEDTFFEFYVTVEGDTYFGEVVEEDGLVVYNDYFVETHPTYGDDLYLVHPARFQDTHPVEFWVYNKVVDYQDNGLPGLIQIAPWYYMFNTGGWNKTADPTIQIVFPGFEMLDTEISLTYEGVLTRADNSLEVVGYVELGEDVTEAKVAVVEGNGVTDAIINGISDDSISSVTIGSTGQVNVPFEPGDGSKFTLVAVAYYEGEVRSYDSATFSYSAGTPETWSLVCEGTYTYLEFWEENLGLEPEVLELYESDTNPGRYKITHWFYDSDFLFTLDEDNMILVEEAQPTGFTNAGTPVVVDDFVYWGDGAESELEDGIYWFAVMYYPQGSTTQYYAYGYESFEPVDVNTRAARTSKLSGKKNMRKVTRMKPKYFNGFKKSSSSLLQQELNSNKIK